MGLTPIVAVRCLKCNRIFLPKDVYHRYRLCATISDSSALVNITAFGGMLDCIFGSKATEFHHRNVSRLREKYGAAVDPIIKAAVEQTFIGQSFIFGFKVPKFNCTNRTGQMQHRQFSLKDLCQNLVGFSQRTCRGSLPQLIAVQILPQTYSKPIITVTQSLQRLESAIEKLNLHTLDLLDNCKLLPLNLSHNKFADSEEASSLSRFKEEGNVSQRRNSSWRQSLVSSCEESSLGFSCDNSLAQMLSSQQSRQCLIVSPCLKVSGSSCVSDKINPLSEINLNSQMASCAAQSAQMHDIQKTEKKDRQSVSMTTMRIRRSKRIAAKRQSSSNCFLDNDGTSDPLEFKSDKENEKKPEIKDRKRRQYHTKNKNWPSETELNADECSLNRKCSKCQNEIHLQSNNHQVIILCERCTAINSRFKSLSTTWSVKKYIRGENVRSKRKNKTGLKRILDSSVNHTHSDIEQNELLTPVKNNGCIRMLNAQSDCTSNISTEMLQISSNSVTGKMPGQVQDENSSQRFCERQSDFSQYSLRSMEITPNVTLSNNMYDFEDKVDVPTAVWHSGTESPSVSKTAPSITDDSVKIVPSKALNKDYSDESIKNIYQDQDKKHKKNVLSIQNESLHDDKEVVEDMPDSEALDQFLMAALDEYEASNITHDSKQVTNFTATAAESLRSEKGHEKFASEKEYHVNRALSSSCDRQGYNNLKYSQSKQENNWIHSSEQSHYPHPAIPADGKQKKKTLSLKNNHFSKHYESLTMTDVSANVILRRSQRKNKSRRHLKTGYEYPSIFNDTASGHILKHKTHSFHRDLAHESNLQDAPDSEDLWQFLDYCSSQNLVVQGEKFGEENSSLDKHFQWSEQKVKRDMINGQGERYLTMPDSMQEEKAVVINDIEHSVVTNQKSFVLNKRKETKDSECYPGPEERHCSKISEEYTSTLAYGIGSEDMFSTSLTSNSTAADKQVLKSTNLKVVENDLNRNKSNSLGRKITNEPCNALSVKLTTHESPNIGELSSQCHNIPPRSYNLLQPLPETCCAATMHSGPSIQETCFSLMTSPQSDDLSSEEVKCSHPILHEGLSQPFRLWNQVPQEQSTIQSPGPSTVKTKGCNMQSVVPNENESHCFSKTGERKFSRQMSFSKTTTQLHYNAVNEVSSSESDRISFGSSSKQLIASSEKESCCYSKRDETRISRQLTFSKNTPTLYNSPVSDVTHSVCDRRISFGSSSKQSNDSFDLFGSQDTFSSPVITEPLACAFSKRHFSLEGSTKNSCDNSLCEYTNNQEEESVEQEIAIPKLPLKKETFKAVLTKKVRFSEVNNQHYFFDSVIICSNRVRNEKVGILKSCLKKSLPQNDDVEHGSYLGSQDLFSDSSQEDALANILHDTTSDCHGVRVVAREPIELFSESFSSDSSKCVADPVHIRPDSQIIESFASCNHTNLLWRNKKGDTDCTSNLSTVNVNSVNENNSGKEEQSFESSPELFSPSHSLLTSPSSKTEGAIGVSPQRVASCLYDSCITPELFS